MKQLALRDGQPGNWEEPYFFWRRLEIVRFHEYGWQEPYESRGSRTVVWERGVGIPLYYLTLHFVILLVNSRWIGLRQGFETRPWGKATDIEF